MTIFKKTVPKTVKMHFKLHLLMIFAMIHYLTCEDKNLIDNQCHFQVACLALL